MKSYSNSADIEKRILEIIHFIPVLTGPAPSNWDYVAIDMVTAQTTSGTGFMTELSQSFNDLIGAGSNRTNKKIANATAWCKADLRMQCLRKGGNALLSTQIDFTEIGSGATNMLMVCMAGTAINLTDLNKISSEAKERIEEIFHLLKELQIYFPNK